MVEAGRMDLVEGILREGGWLASGWDLDEEEYGVEEEKQEAYGTGLGHINGAICEGFKNRDWHEGNVIREGDEGERLEGSIFQFDLQSSASSSGRLLEELAKNNIVEGILTRLEKEREINFGVGLKEKGFNSHTTPNYFVADWLSKTSVMGTAASLARNIEAAPLQLMDSEVDNMMSKHDQGQPDLNVDNFSNSHGQDSWRVWSIERAGSSNTNFEAGEINYNDFRKGFRNMDSNDHGVQERGGRSRFIYPKEESSSINSIGHHDIRSRLQTLEVELSSVLLMLKSQSGESPPKMDHKSSSQELLNLSDAAEFRENEIMSLQNKLRSIRAKLAVLEGKMALAIMCEQLSSFVKYNHFALSFMIIVSSYYGCETQKVVEVKQKRIDDAHRALQLLRNACIVWPNSASEVLLAGSFDGLSGEENEVKNGHLFFESEVIPGQI